MPPRTFGEVLRPALSDRQGWAVFLGTPAGKNQFYDVVQQAKLDATWGYAKYRASQTGIISAADRRRPQGHDRRSLRAKSTNVALKPRSKGPSSPPHWPRLGPLDG